MRTSARVRQLKVERIQHSRRKTNVHEIYQVKKTYLEQTIMEVKSSERAEWYSKVDFTTPKQKSEEWKNQVTFLLQQRTA